MDVMQFTQALSRIWVLETRLLDKTKVERMLEANSADEVLKILGETEYANIMGNIKRAADYEEILSTELKRVYKLVYELCPVKEIVDLMSTKYKYHNIKVLLKGNVEKAVLEVIADFEANKDPQKIDIIVDRYMFKELDEIKKSLNYKFTDKLVNAMIDSTNVRTLLRVKKQGKGREFASEVLVTGGSISKDTLVAIINETPENIISKLSTSIYSDLIKEGVESYIATNSANLLEKLSDNYIMDLMKSGKLVTFGPERILSYIYAKETEIKIIRIIMVGKLNNITEEVIRERLRDIYV